MLKGPPVCGYDGQRRSMTPHEWIGALPMDVLRLAAAARDRCPPTEIIITGSVQKRSRRNMCVSSRNPIASISCFAP